MKPGDTVVLDVPENPRLHGAGAVVESMTTWGAHVRAPVAATGQYRALFSEMVPERSTSKREAVGQGYTGDICPTCGALRMRRNGNCLLCDSCGSTSGCG